MLKENRKGGFRKHNGVNEGSDSLGSIESFAYLDPLVP